MKAQAASEFLLVMGFAILVVAVAISVLSYFGIINITNFAPERCLFPAGMDCIDKVITKDGITLALKNNYPSKLYITNVSLSSCTPTSKKIAIGKENNYSDLPILIPKEELYKIQILCQLPSGERIRDTIKVYYANQETGIENSFSGTLSVKVP